MSLEFFGSPKEAYFCAPFWYIRLVISNQRGGWRIGMMYFFPWWIGGTPDLEDHPEWASGNINHEKASLPNGRTSWPINGDDPNHLRVLGWSSEQNPPKSTTGRVSQLPQTSSTVPWVCARVWAACPGRRSWWGFEWHGFSIADVRRKNDQLT